MCDPCRERCCSVLLALMSCSGAAAQSSPPHCSRWYAGSSREDGPPGFELLAAAASSDLPAALLALAPMCREAVTWADMSGRRLAHIAAEQGSAAALEALLCSGYASPSDITRGGDSLLHVAAGGQTAGHLAAMRLLLRLSPELALARGDGGYLGLHLAAEGGSPEAVSLLLDAAPLAATWVAEQDGRVPVRVGLSALEAWTCTCWRSGETRSECRLASRVHRFPVRPIACLLFGFSKWQREAILC